jgi:hypothetical protein
VAASLLSGVSGSCRRQGNFGRKFEERPQVKERKEKGRAGKKGFEVEADPLSFGQN